MSSDASASMPVPRPSSSAWKASLTEELAVALALSAEPVVTPRSSSQPWISSAAAWRLAFRLSPWLETPASTARTSKAPSAEDRQEHDRRPEPAPDPVALECSDHRREHGRHDRCGDHGRHDDLGDGEQPCRAGQQDRHADEEPGTGSEVAQPAGSRERSGKLTRADRNDIRVFTAWFTTHDLSPLSFHLVAHGGAAGRTNGSSRRRRRVEPVGQSEARLP